MGDYYIQVHVAMTTKISWWDALKLRFIDKEAARKLIELKTDAK